MRLARQPASAAVVLALAAGALGACDEKKGVVPPPPSPAPAPSVTPPLTRPPAVDGAPGPRDGDALRPRFTPPSAPVVADGQPLGKILGGATQLWALGPGPGEPGSPPPGKMTGALISDAAAVQAVLAAVGPGQVRRPEKVGCETSLLIDFGDATDVLLGTVELCQGTDRPRPALLTTPGAKVPARIDVAEPDTVERIVGGRLMGVVLDLSEDGRPLSRLFADGRTESAWLDATGRVERWVPGPTLRPDGTILFTKSEVTARVEPGGDIYVVSPSGASPREQLFGRIVGNELRFPGPDGSWAARLEGQTLRLQNRGPTTTVVGAVDEAARRTALVMTAAFYIDLAIVPRAGSPGPRTSPFASP